MNMISERRFGISSRSLTIHIYVGVEKKSAKKRKGGGGGGGGGGGVMHVLFPGSLSSPNASGKEMCHVVF